MGASARQEWVDAPVPWINTTTGPDPMRCTCQSMPPARMKWL
jgi:hypothetical protein